VPRHLQRNPRLQSDIERLMRPGWDATSFLTVYLVLVCGLPSDLTVPMLGSAGRPSTLWGLAALLWWTWNRLGAAVPPKVGSGLVRFALMAFVGCVLAGYAYANFRGLPGPEASPADSGMLRLAGWIGIALIAADGIETRERLQTLLRRIVIAGALMAALGLAQFWTGETLVDWISLPGFVVDSSLAGVEGRGGFVRPQGMAAHPLEYGVVLCMSLPIAISLAMAEKKRSVVARWLPSAVIAFASLLSVSRSALLGVLAGVLILAPRWSPRVRLYAVVAAGGLGAIMYSVVPGMAGTLKGMFLGVVDDPSTVSRTNTYEITFEIAARNPFLGRGFSTFLPQYLILDNQYLGLLIEVGLVGLAAFLALVVTSIIIPWNATRRSNAAGIRQLGAAISASVAATALTLAFFDGLGFPMSAGLLFLMFGISASTVRSAREY
jgi:O-antigen ligase